MSFFDQVGSVLPKMDLKVVGQFAYWGLIFFLILLVVAGAFALWAWWFITKRRYKYTIRIFEKVDGRYKPTISDKAMEKKLGGTGDTIFYLQKLKKIVPTPTIQTGNNTFWFAKREDGELINIGMEDIDLKLKEARVNYLDKETRYARVELQKAFKDRYEKETFWQKYGRDILTIIFVVVISVMLLLIASKLTELIGSISTLQKSSADIMEKASGVMSRIDTLCSNSGLAPITTK
jgi:hypothetical protein